MQLVNGSTDVTTYFVLRDSTAHAPKTDVTITDIDVYYLEQGAAMAAKADLTALAAADSAHADNQGYHCGQGLYRIDWPDAAFDGGIGKKVYLAVVCTGVDTEYREVELVAANTGDAYARLGAPAGASHAADVAAVKVDTAAVKAKTDSLTFTVAGDLDANVQSWAGASVATPSVAGVPEVDLTHVGGAAASGVATVDANVTTIANGAITAAAIATGAIDADALAADAGTEIGAAVKTAIEAAGSHLTLILEDTGTTLPATLDTIDNFLDTEVAAILQDTDEMQKDLMNGGRLDLLIDAIKAKTDLMLDQAAIRTAVEADGSKLDVLYDDWLNGGRLDLLLDAAAAGGDVFSTEIPGAYAVGTAGYIIGTNLDAKVSEAGGGAGDGTGADEVTITWTSNGLPVGGGDVWITTDPSGDNVVAGTLQTNDNGQATFMLDDGSVYFLWGQRSGVNAIRGERFVAVAD